MDTKGTFLTTMLLVSTIVRSFSDERTQNKMDGFFWAGIGPLIVILVVYSL